MKVAVDDPTDRVAVLRIGPTWSEDPGVLFGWLFACSSLNALAFKARHLEVVASTTAGEWLVIYEAVLVHLRGAVATSQHMTSASGTADAEALGLAPKRMAAVLGAI